VTEHGAGASGEDRCHPPAFHGENRVADGEDTAIDDVEPSLFDPVIDGATADPDFEELAASDHPVLATGDRCDQMVDPGAIRRARPIFAPHTVANFGFGGHGEETGGSSDAVGTRFAADLCHAAGGSVTTEA
jgi:hypothetical protein